MEQRIIKFRGKRIDNGEWVYGYLLHIDSAPFIFPFGAKIHHAAHWGEKGSFGIIGSGTIDAIIGFGERVNGMWLCEVAPETVGQYTGRKDINSIEIYQGDIVELNHSGHKSQYEVVWSDENAGWHMIHAKREGDEYGLYTRNFGLKENKKIVGNITHPA